MAPEPKDFALSGAVPSSNSLSKMDDGILANNIMDLGHHALLPDPSMLKPLRMGLLGGLHCNECQPISDDTNLCSWPSSVARR